MSVRLDEYARKEAPDGDLEVHVGQVCLAHFDTDNAWYRARVLETTKTNVKVSCLTLHDLLNEREGRNWLMIFLTCSNLI